MRTGEHQIVSALPVLFYRIHKNKNRHLTDVHFDTIRAAPCKNSREVQQGYQVPPLCRELWAPAMLGYPRQRAVWLRETMTHATK